MGMNKSKDKVYFDKKLPYEYNTYLYSYKNYVTRELLMFLKFSNDIN